VGTDGNQIGSEPNLPIGFATYSEVGTANQVTPAVYFANGPNPPFGSPADVVLDDIGGAYQNAAALQAALGSSSGNFVLGGSNVFLGNPAFVDPYTQFDILVAYNQVNPSTGATQVRIADVTLTNATGNTVVADTAVLNPVVHDLVHITTTVGQTGLSNLTAHNIDIIS